MGLIYVVSYAKQNESFEATSAHETSIDCCPVERCLFIYFSCKLL